MGQETWSNKQWLDSQLSAGISSPGASYTTYVASMTQTSTNAPTAVVHENTLGATPVFAYDGVGAYSVTIAGGFDYLNSVVFVSSPTGSPNQIRAYIWTDGVLYLEVVDFSDTAANDILVRAGIEIRIYS